MSILHNITVDVACAPFSLLGPGSGVSSGPKQDFSNTDGTQTLRAPHDTVNIPESLSQRVIAAQPYPAGRIQIAPTESVSVM